MGRFSATSSSGSTGDDVESSGCKQQRTMIVYNSNMFQPYCFGGSCNPRSSSEDTESESESSEYSSASEDESDSSEPYGCGSVDLTYERLASLQHSSKRVSTTYAKGGTSGKRLKRALEKPVCSCQCRAPYRIVLRLCVAFWSLGKSIQDRLLWGLQHEAGNRRKEWFLQGLSPS